MGKPAKQNIFLYTGYTPRATALIERVEKACGEQTSILLIEDVSHILEKRVQNIESIVLLDLPNIKQPAIKTIRSVKEHSDDIKLIAIHIYTTKLLIEPLIQAGIHGYLTYEPSATEIREAIGSVLKEEIYLPDQIYL